MFGRHGSYCCCICLCCITYFFIFLAFIIFWLIFLPQEPKFVITDVSLTQFNFTSTNNTLHYNLTLNINIRNPNKKVGIDYRRILVIANYRKKRFALVRLNSTPFYQGHMNTTIVHVDLQGQQLMKFGESDLSKFNSETATGVYSIDVKIALRIGIRFGQMKTGYFKIPRKRDCKLKVPLSTSINGTVSNDFKTTDCMCFISLETLMPGKFLQNEQMYKIRV